jgi:hypothetical protein
MYIFYRDDLIIIDRKRKISLLNEYVEQEEYDIKLTLAKVLYLALYH